jgi:hypothetical protein
MRRVIAGFCLSLLPVTALADGILIANNDVPSLFHIAKSENKNQVHFAARLDARCRFVHDDEPVLAYWRDREVSATATSELTMFEEPAYGLGEIERLDDGRARVALRALPGRPIDLEVYRSGDGRCTGRAYAVVGGERARLREVFVKLDGWSVEYVVVQAHRVRDGVLVEERLQP